MSDPPADARAFPATSAEPLRREFLAPTVLAIGGVGLWSVTNRFLSKAIFPNCPSHIRSREIGRAIIPVEVTRGGVANTAFSHEAETSARQPYGSRKPQVQLAPTGPHRYLVASLAVRTVDGHSYLPTFSCTHWALGSEMIAYVDCDKITATCSAPC